MRDRTGQTDLTHILNRHTDLPLIGCCRLDSQDILIGTCPFTLISRRIIGQTKRCRCTTEFIGSSDRITLIVNDLIIGGLRGTVNLSACYSEKNAEK